MYMLPPEPPPDSLLEPLEDIIPFTVKLLFTISRTEPPPGTAEPLPRSSGVRLEP